MRSAFAAVILCLMLSACGGGGGGGSSSTASTSTTTSTTTTTTTTTTPAVLTNFATITVDTGPAALQSGPNGYDADNSPYVSVTLCAPGSTTNCQTIDHVLLDTGSVGLRIPASVLNAGLLSAMPAETDPNANPVGECYGFVDGYVFGSVRAADFKIGGETVSGMPVNVLGDSGAFAAVPSSCSSGGGNNLNTVQGLGGNGILGVGVTTTDCGAVCTSAGGNGAAAYYDCPSAGCATSIARAASTAAPFQQLPNPVAAMSVDNNGTIISLAAPPTGQPSMTGTVFFGIGTQTNNGLGSATVFTTTTSSSPRGAGTITVVYNNTNKTLTDSVIDSGSNAYFFVDTGIAACTATDLTGFYCPATPVNLSVTIKGQNGASVTDTLVLNNAQTILGISNAVAPGIGVNPNLNTNFNSPASSFDLGLPFFYGRNVYTAIEGRSAGGATGPYFAF